MTVTVWAPMEGLRLPQAVQRIAAEGTCLLWVSDSAHGSFYEVTDGARFEERFNALRRHRHHQSAGGYAQRSFSGMHRHFVLLSGDGWARTGSKFCPKPVGSCGVQAPFLRPASPRPAVPASPKASGSWFFQDVKYCYRCGQGSTSEARQKCCACNGTEWTWAAGESTSVMKRFLTLIQRTQQAKREGHHAAAHHAGDYIVTGSQQEALMTQKIY